MTLSLDDIAWLLNLRGGDVNYNPVFVSHLLLDGSGWHYLAAGSGFNGDFNFILSHFS